MHPTAFHVGYPRFAAHGGDIGSHVTDFLGARHAERVVGIHTHHPNLHPTLDGASLTAGEERYLEKRAAGDGADSSYAEVQASRPDVLGAGLHDSPVGLAAWIAERLRERTGDGFDLGDIAAREMVLQTVCLYWFSGSIASSFRPYHDDHETPELGQVHVPAGVTVTDEDAGYPREFAARTYTDLRQWRKAAVGHHFLAFEEPDRLAQDLRDLFRPLR